MQLNPILKFKSRAIALLAAILLLFALQAGAETKSVYYGFDKDHIVQQSLTTLSSLFQNYDGETVIINAYTDSTGPEMYNQDLSNRRAQNLKKYIADTFSIPFKNIETLGMGENSNHIENYKNRRAEITLSRGYQRAQIQPVGNQKLETNNTDNDFFEGSNTLHQEKLFEESNQHSEELFEDNAGYTNTLTRSIASEAFEDNVHASNHNVYFNVDKDRPVRAEGTKLVDALKEYTSGYIYLYGFADPSGSVAYNLDLSKRRSINIKKVIVALKNVDPQFVRLFYLGEDNSDGMSYKSKRRVSVYWGGSTQQMFAATPIDDSNVQYRWSPPAAAPAIAPNPAVEPAPIIVAEPEPMPEAMTPEPAVEASSIIEEEPEEEYDRGLWVAGFIGPQMSSAYYEGDLAFEHGKTTFLNFGIRAGYKLSPRWDLEAYAYYLPTEVDEATSIVNFAGTQSVDYENNMYGAFIKRSLHRGDKSRLGVSLGYTSHIIGSIEGLGPATFGFDKFNHTGINLGLYYERALSKRWQLNTEAHYILPLDVGDVTDSEPGLWYEAGLGLMRWHNEKEKWQYGIDYRVYYHESDLTHEGALNTNAEYFIQTLMLGLKRQF